MLIMLAPILSFHHPPPLSSQRNPTKHHKRISIILLLSLLQSCYSPHRGVRLSTPNSSGCEWQETKQSTN